MTLRSYPQIYNLGHPAIDQLFDGTVEVTEKIDGSQFSFGRRGSAYSCRSKGKDQSDGPDALFKLAVEQTRDLDLREGWTYRGEFLAKPKHNVLAYSRIPEHNVILFNVDVGYERYLPYDRMYEEGRRLDLEVVPILTSGSVPDWEALEQLLETESCLGGVKVEGVVVKNYERFGQDGKVLMGKFVSEAFKERHTKEWRRANPQAGDVVEQLIAGFGKEAIWRKAIQHLRDEGSLLDAPQDIGLLMREINEDVLRESENEVKVVLFRWAWPKLSRAITAGFPQWYKEELAKSQFSGEGES